MSDLTRHAVRRLLEPHAPPCVSLYQHTHRRHPDNRQDPIRFKNLLREIESSLRQGFPDVDDLLAPFRALGEDAAFWNHTLDGLAVFGAPGLFQVFRVQRPVEELALVATTFSKPLHQGAARCAAGHRMVGPPSSWSRDQEDATS